MSLSFAASVLLFFLVIIDVAQTLWIGLPLVRSSLKITKKVGCKFLATSLVTSFFAIFAFGYFLKFTRFHWLILKIILSVALVFHIFTNDRVKRALDD